MLKGFHLKIIVINTVVMNTLRNYCYKSWAAIPYWFLTKYKITLAEKIAEFFDARWKLQSKYMLTHLFCTKLRSSFNFHFWKMSHKQSFLGILNIFIALHFLWCGYFPIQYQLTQNELSFVHSYSAAWTATCLWSVNGINGEEIKWN